MSVSAEGYFPETIAAALAGSRPRFAYLVELGFDTPALFWNGNRTLTTKDDRVWIGARQMGSISGLEESLNGDANAISIVLSGAVVTSEVMQLAAGEDRSLYMWKLLRVWLQFFDDDWQPLDNPYALQAALITGLQFDRSAAGQDGTATRTLTVQAVNIFYGRSASPNGYYTDTDQQSRYPGDLGLQFIPSLQDSTVSIPW